MTSRLSRVLDTEVMDSLEDAHDYDAMDHAEVNRRFAEDFLAAGPDARRVLDLGAGPARIAIEVCRRHPGIRVVAVDLAQAMLDRAAANIQRAGLAGRIELLRADAKQLPLADKAFSAVMSNSIVHHIPEPRGVLREAIRVTARGGVIFFRDLLRPRDEANWSALVRQYAAGCSPRQRQLFGDSLRAALSLEEVQGLVTALGYPAESVAATTDRHWTWIARRI